MKTSKGEATANDEELMRRYQSGDVAAFSELFVRHQPRVSAFVAKRVHNHAHREELVQSAFLKLHQSRHQYQSGLPFAPWLFVIVRSVLGDHWRKQARQADEPGHAAIELAEGEATTLGESRRDLEEILATLPDKQRQALELRFLNGASFLEVAQALRVSEGGARQVISRAVRAIRRGLRGES